MTPRETPLADHVRVGKRWLEWETGRVVEITHETIHDTGVGCRYVDDGRWFYCDALDFVVWGRFRPVGR